MTTSIAIHNFSISVDNIMITCQQDLRFKEVLIGKLANIKQQKAIKALEKTIEQRKDLMEIDEDDVDIKNYRTMQDTIFKGQYKIVKDQYWQMDTSPRESIPDEVDEWLNTCHSLESSI